MAVTINSQPTKYMTSDNPLVYEFTSNQASQPNFSYKVETYINSMLVANDTIFPERTSGRGHIDISPIVKTRIYKPTRPTALVDEVVLPDVQVKVIENYGTPPADQANATSNNITIVKAKLGKREWLTKSLLNDYTNKKWLTDVPNNTIFATRTQDVYLNMLSLSSGERLTIDLYDEYDVLIDTYSADRNFDMWTLNVSYANLLAVMLDMNDGKYIMVAVDQSEQMKVVYIDEDCIQKNIVSWMNKYGAFDQFVFTHNNTTNQSIESFGYTKQFGGWVGNVYTFDANNSGQIDTVKVYSDRGVLISGWIGQHYQNWLVSLAQSIDVRLNGRKINVTTSQFTMTQERFEELISQEIAYFIDSDTTIV